MLYTMILDHNNYLPMAWDTAQIESIVGASMAAMDKRIDMWGGVPRSYKDIYKEPLRVSFPKTSKENKNCEIPDIAHTHGRLFLNPKAYEVLKPLIENDGEFLPLIYENGEAYFFNPLRVAEDVDGLDKALTCRNEWGDIDHLALHEEKVKDWAAFRCEYNNFNSLICQQHIKDAIENAGLTGLYITPDLANIFPEDRSAVTRVN